MKFTLFEKKEGGARKGQGVVGNLSIVQFSCRRRPEGNFIDTTGQEYTLEYVSIKWLNRDGICLEGYKSKISRSGAMEYVLYEWFCAFKEGEK